MRFGDRGVTFFTVFPRLNRRPPQVIINERPLSVVLKTIGVPVPGDPPILMSQAHQKGGSLGSVKNDLVKLNHKFINWTSSDWNSCDLQLSEIQ